jgi:hypothetical protein
MSFSPRSRQFLRRLLILAGIVVGGYALLIGIWVLLNPRW